MLSSLDQRNASAHCLLDYRWRYCIRPARLSRFWSTAAVKSASFLALSAVLLAFAPQGVRAAEGDTSSVNKRAPMKFAYPATARGSQVDDYHGTQIADPYRWLEELDSDATKEW